jgi:hypothetical protein
MAATGKTAPFSPICAGIGGAAIFGSSTRRRQRRNTTSWLPSMASSPSAAASTLRADDGTRPTIGRSIPGVLHPMATDTALSTICRWPSRDRRPRRFRRFSAILLPLAHAEAVLRLTSPLRHALRVDHVYIALDVDCDPLVVPGEGEELVNDIRLVDRGGEPPRLSRLLPVVAGLMMRERGRGHSSMRMSIGPFALEYTDRSIYYGRTER